jgi:hypothetical protein
MINADSLENLNVGDSVAHFEGLVCKERIVERVTTTYIVVKDYYGIHFKKKDGKPTHPGDGFNFIAVVTPEIQAQWDKQKLIEEFTELMNRRKNFEVKALKKALQRLLSENLTQDELIKISSCVIECKSLSIQTLKEATNDLWGGVS